MRASRLVSIVLLLQTRGRMSASALAHHFEVSPRTIHRDMDALGAAGIPVYAERGTGGGFRLAEGYRMRPSALSAPEAAALLVGGAPAAAAALGVRQDFDDAQLKVMAAMGPDQLAAARTIHERFHLDAPGWFEEEERPPHLAAVADAVWRGRVIRVRYERWEGEVERTLHPLGLVLKGAAWYLVASVEGTTRTYRVARIQELQALNQTCERPSGFDLAAFWATWTADFMGRMFAREATLRLSPRAFERLPQQFEPVMRDAAWRSAGPPDASGWRVVRVPIQSIAYAALNLLRLGADVEVLAPAELRGEVRARAAEIVALYGGG